MTAFEKFVYYVLQARMEKPELYHSFHIISILLTIALTVCAVKFLRDVSDKKMRIILFFGWLLMVIFEIAKQLKGAMSFDGQTVTWAYNWNYFPFQFCSTPMYTLPLVVFLKDGKVRRAVMAYIATFSLFAGIIVMILPTTVFSPHIIMNIQTMLHHGLQVVIGVWMASYNRH
ncbi:MAG: YwaF family protein, partial [Clostridia bacterium]|nr:YwaF family protein [Clostridia bacterium]